MGKRATYSPKRDPTESRNDTTIDNKEFISSLGNEAVDASMRMTS